MNIVFFTPQIEDEQLTRDWAPVLVEVAENCKIVYYQPFVERKRHTSPGKSPLRNRRCNKSSSFIVKGKSDEKAFQFCPRKKASYHYKCSR